MELAVLLEQNRETVLGRWFDLIIKTYPRATAEFLAKQEDQFRNPVGHAISQAIGPIYDQILAAMDTRELMRALDGIIRIRSVQEFTPSQAVAFIFQLKTVIRGEIHDQLRRAESWDQLAELESRIDRVALLAFEKYSECREKLHELRGNEIRDRTMKLLERVELTSTASQHEEEFIDGAG